MVAETEGMFRPTSALQAETKLEALSSGRRWAEEAGNETSLHRSPTALSLICNQVT